MVSDLKSSLTVVWKWAYFRKRFHEAIKSGKKFHTLRNARLGREGEFVACPVGLIRIEEITKETPRRVAQVYWEAVSETPPGTPAAGLLLGIATASAVALLRRR